MTCYMEKIEHGFFPKIPDIVTFQIDERNRH